jgi:putative transposase
MACEINRVLKQKRDFWQVEAFDHLVRSPEWFEHYRQYIAQNPARARLRPTEYRHYARHLSQ